jgi:tRNA U34 5-methylaminomethyl-2-thiouridine-forming methyltransferase MnmC
MEMEIVTTADGSNTLYLPALDEHYHSTNGALGESMHVFVRAGYDFCKANPVSIFEAGFGTGLNALLTAIRSIETKRPTSYTAMEKYPLSAGLLNKLNYCSILGPASEKIWRRIHKAKWDTTEQITDYFVLRKLRGDLLTDKSDAIADLVYFDVFAHSKQPEIWALDVLERTCSMLGSNGIFVTYSARGELKRNLRSLGFEITLLPGATGKREMIRAIKKEIL